MSVAWDKHWGHLSLQVIHQEWLTGGWKSPWGEADLRERPEETGSVHAFRWQTVRVSSSPASPPDAKFNTANAALFFPPPLFFFNADYKATAKNISSTIKHQMVTPFPQLVWVKTVKLYPCFSGESPGVRARQAQHRALVLLLFVPGLALFLALDTIQPPFSIVCHFTYGSSAPNVCMYPENAAFHYVFSM